MIKQSEFDDQVYLEYLDYNVDKIEIQRDYNYTYYMCIYIKENE